VKQKNYHHGKHTKGGNTNIAKLTFAIISIVCVVVIGVIIFDPRNSTEAKTLEDTTSNVSNQISTLTEQTKGQVGDVIKTVSTENIPNKIGGYKVIGKIVIEKVGIDNSILSVTDDYSIDLGITKFWGPNINDVGNLSLIGHNYVNLFKNLKDLKIGDTFYLINKENGTKVDYKINKIYTVQPNDVSCIETTNKDEREVTLITCNNGGKTRLVLKAKQI